MNKPNYIVLRHNCKKMSLPQELQTNPVNLNHSRTKNVHFYFQYIKEWNIGSLFLLNCQQRTILKSISSIEFAYLTYLNIESNKVESLEGINQIWMPVLQNLLFESNSVCFVDDLRKLFCPNLRRVLLGGNRIKEVDILFSMLSPNLKDISIEVQRDRRARGVNQYQGIRWLAKLEAHNLYLVRRKKQGEEKRTWDSLKRKYPSMKNE